jgi:hypothetical protein
LGISLVGEFQKNPILLHRAWAIADGLEHEGEREVRRPDERRLGLARGLAQLLDAEIEVGFPGIGVGVGRELGSTEGLGGIETRWAL